MNNFKTDITEDMVKYLCSNKLEYYYVIKKYNEIENDNSYTLSMDKFINHIKVCFLLIFYQEYCLTPQSCHTYYL